MSKFTKGHKPWNEGKPVSEEMKQRISLTLKRKGIKPTVHWEASGADNHEWKGDNVSYSGLHYWIYRQLGKPNHCEHCDNPRKRFTWANKSHEYKRNLEDWLSLCYSCHKKYDLAYRRNYA